MPGASPVRWAEVCVSRRTVVLAGLTDGRHILLKWPDKELGHTQSRELEAFALLARMPLPDITRRALPKVLSGPGREVSVYDAAVPCTSLRELFDAGELDLPRIVALAAVLAGLHSTSVAGIGDDHVILLPAPKNTLLTVSEYAHGLGSEYREWICVVQGLAGHLAELHESWQPRSLIHFDLRDDNILFVPSGDAGLVRLIDWEFAGIGDPHYDLGYIVAQFIQNAIRQPGLNETGSVLSGHALRQIGLFLSAYRKLSGAVRTDTGTVVRHAGLILLQQSSYRLEQFGALGRSGRLCLMIAEGLIRHPELVLSHLGEELS